MGVLRHISSFASISCPAGYDSVCFRLLGNQQLEALDLQLSSCLHDLTGSSVRTPKGSLHLDCCSNRGQFARPALEPVGIAIVLTACSHRAVAVSSVLHQLSTVSCHRTDSTELSLFEAGSLATHKTCVSQSSSGPRPCAVKPHLPHQDYDDPKRQDPGVAQRVH